MEDLEKRLNDLLFELPQKREDVEKLQQCYDTELLTQRELRIELDSLQTEVKSLRAQLELSNNALNRCEEIHREALNTAVCQKLNLDAANHTIESMMQQSTKLHLENVRLKKQIEDLERSIKSELFFRESCKANQSKIQETVETITLQMRNLAKDYRDTERVASQAVSLGNQCRLMLEPKDKKIGQLHAQVEESLTLVRSLTCQNINLQNSLKERNPEENHFAKEIFQEWQTSVKEMKLRLANSEKETEQLQESLKNALKAQSKFQELEVSANKHVKQLEDKLKEANAKKKEEVTDCSVQTDVTIMNDTDCQTSLEIVDISTQTDHKIQESQEDANMTKEDENMDFVQNSQNVLLTSMLTDNTLLSHSSLSDLMSRYQLEKDSLASTMDFSDSPTQVNSRQVNL